MRRGSSAESLPPILGWRALRNIFDQYQQPENRVTHALLTALHEDRKLLASFLREILGIAPPVSATALQILSQRLPGQEQPSEKEAEKRGLPDGWIHDGDCWCVIIESKVLIRVTADQIRRHRITAERRGFSQTVAVAITPTALAAPLSDTVCCTWQDIYVWLRRESGSSGWAARVAQYLEIAEARLSAEGALREGTLTRFAGIPFDADNPFNYPEAKRILNVAMSELRTRADLQSSLRVHPRREGRPAITHDEGRVWDFLWMSGAGPKDIFTSFPHMTLGIHADAVVAMITVPNSIKTQIRNRIRDLGYGGFQLLIARVLENMRALLESHPGASPRMKGIQRRYASQRGPIFVDAEIDFDLRTAIPDSGDPKLQQRWLEAAYGSFTSKQGANYQIQLGVRFPYKLCPALKEEGASDMIARAWLACRPLVELAF